MRSRVTITESDGVATVRGWRARDLLAAAGIRPTFVRGGWMIDAHRVPDLLALLERRGIAAEVGSDYAPVPGETPESSDSPTRVPGTDMPPLWPDGGDL